MLTFISCAKTMATKPQRLLDGLQLLPTTPRHEAMAHGLAARMAEFSAEQLAQLLRTNAKIGADNYARYQRFHDEDNPLMAALEAYTGVVFKYLEARSLDADTWRYAQEHLRITSFLYGLLRPMDAIRAYRLEGGVCLEGMAGDIFAHWRDVLTPMLLEDVAKAGGALCHLASDEMRRLFHWRTIEAEVEQLYIPEFHLVEDGKLKTKVVYTKMARGAMTRYILTNRITTREGLEAFAWDGFAYDDRRSDAHRLVYTLEV